MWLREEEVGTTVLHCQIKLACGPRRKPVPLRLLRLPKEDPPARLRSLGTDPRTN